MAGIYTRKAISAILNDEALTPEERTDQLFSLYGRAIDDGYITKSAAQAAQASAIEEAKAQAIREFKMPDIKETEEYKNLLNEFNGYKTKQEARSSADYASVKPKFFDVVYDRIDRADGAKPVKDQLLELKKNYEEYFNPDTEDKKPSTPQFGGETKGAMPTGEGEGSFAKYWGYKRKE